MDRVHTIIESKMRDYDVPGLQFAVIEGNRIVELGYRGISDVATGNKVDSKTIFPLNSIAKAFTGVAILQLVEEGKLQLDDSVGTHLNDLPKEWRSRTVRQLLTHMSGLPDILDPKSERWLAESVGPEWDKIQHQPIEFQAGERFQYNCTNYVLLGLIIDRLSGKPFAEYVRERQLEVAGMKSTGFSDDFDVIPNRVRCVTNMRYTQEEWKRYSTPGYIFETFPPFMRTAAGIHSNVSDLARWVIALQEGKLVQDQSLLKELWKPGRLTNGETAGFSDLLNGYALGWPIAVRDSHPAYLAVGGGRSALAVFPDDKLVIIILSNRLGAAPEMWIDEVRAAYMSR
jgi:CubicO group peptidase (beta-lactamase class C family)